VASLHRSGASVGTLRSVYRTFHTIMASALMDQVIEGDPCAGVKLPRDDDKREMTFLRPKEVAPTRGRHRPPVPDADPYPRLRHRSEARPQPAIGGTLTRCDPFVIPSTLHWTGAAIIVKRLRTKTCIVTRSKTSSRPMPSSLAG
jgi:hypothetical protein